MNNRSPHVTIYKFPITALSSITNRMSGIFLSTGFILYGTSLLLPNNLNYVTYISNNFNAKDSKDPNDPEKNNKLKKLIIFSTSLITSYHTYGSIRHMLWDYYPNLLKNNLVKNSSYIIIGASIYTSFLSLFFIE